VTLGILVTFAVSSALGVALSISATSRSKDRAAVVQIAARQRTLAQRYANDILLVRVGRQADPAYTASLLMRSARALLAGGYAPSVNGDDDGVRLPSERNPVVRRQLARSRLLVADLTRLGRAILQGSRRIPPTMAGERLTARDPIQRLRILALLSSNVSLNAARSIAVADDRNINNLITLQVLLGIGGFLVSLSLACAVVLTTRRQTAHFRSLVNSSTDCVVVFGADNCRYASPSVARLVDRSERELTNHGIYAHIHDDDQPVVRAAAAHAEPREFVFRLKDRFGEWRHLEVHVTDLRADRQIRGVVFNARDISERLELEEQLTHQAFHDSLTELPNRALFRDRLEHALARRGQIGLAVLLIDLDGFKQVNDTLGHNAGDQLLQTVATRFAAVVRAGDTVARLGGDEFAVLLEEVDDKAAVSLAQRLLAALGKPVSIAGRELTLGASVGLAIHSPEESDSRDLIRDADIAMYAAKERGRGRYEIFREEMTRELGELLGIEHELRLGLERGEFALRYQPMIDVDNERLIGVEALLRWEAPMRGEVPPGRFIPIAEATGLIIPLGEFVVRQACKQAAAWQIGADGLFVTWVNVSVKQLAAGGFHAVVKDALSSNGLSPGSFGIEITESAIVEPGVAGKRALAELKELHELGVQIAIDDFGTGFSSLGQLRHFPIDVIKVDRSFIKGIQHDSKDATIASSLISLAHALGVVAVAEGVESSGQLQSIRHLGCDHAQGFLFSRPAAPAEIAALLTGPGRLRAAS
jgi:diguanylate cyclase (GGDEF)-like protein/PAS domain S-box-containing protein